MVTVPNRSARGTISTQRHLFSALRIERLKGIETLAVATECDTTSLGSYTNGGNCAISRKDKETKKARLSPSFTIFPRCVELHSCCCSCCSCSAVTSVAHPSAPASLATPRRAAQADWRCRALGLPELRNRKKSWDFSVSDSTWFDIFNIDNIL